MTNQILIINNDQPVRQAMRLFLENYAFACKEAADGLEALTLLDEGLSVNVILSDYHMPGMNAMNFLKALAYRVSGQEIHVILLIRNLTREIEQIAKQAGAFAIMAKPYDPEKLLAIVSQACHRPISSSARAMKKADHLK